MFSLIRSSFLKFQFNSIYIYLTHRKIFKPHTYNVYKQAEQLVPKDRLFPLSINKYEKQKHSWQAWAWLLHICIYNKISWTNIAGHLYTAIPMLLSLSLYFCFVILSLSLVVRFFALTYKHTLTLLLNEQWIQKKKKLKSFRRQNRPSKMYT